jgi:rubrerythrin
MLQLERKQMAKTLDFANLSLMDALDLAILVEEEAQERYEEFAHQMSTHHTPEAGKFFLLMEQNEARHRVVLAARRKKLFGTAPSTVTREMLWDVEAPEYDGARAFMSLRQALHVVMAAETKAYEFFDTNLKYITDPEVRILFEELREEEAEHQDAVRFEMAKLPAGPDPDPEDYADGPNAQ